MRNRCDLLEKESILALYFILLVIGLKTVEVDYLDTGHFLFATMKSGISHAYILFTYVSTSFHNFM